MSGAEILGALVVLVLLFIGSILAAVETGFTRISRARAEALTERDPDLLVRKLVGDRIAVLTPILLGLATCQLAIASIMTVWGYRRWGTGGAVGAFVGALALVFIFSLAVPKTRALANLDRTTTRVAPLLGRIVAFAPLGWFIRPLVKVARGRSADANDDETVTPAPVSEQEFLALTGQAAQDDAIDSEEQELIESIIEFGDTTVEEVLVPRPDMVTVGAVSSARDAMQVVVDNGYSRIPVVGEDIDDIVGVVHAKDLMAVQMAQSSGIGSNGSGVSVADLMREPYFVPETKRIAKLLREMQAEMFHLAVVVDEYGGTAGIVTLEDLIEEVVGEIVDEFDVEEPMIEALPRNEIMVNGRAPLSALGNLLGADFPEDDWSTVGGLMFNTLGHVPDVGERLEIDDHVLVVERMEGNRIARVRISRCAALSIAPIDVAGAGAAAL